MMNWLRVSSVLLFLLPFFSSCNDKPAVRSDVLSGDYWKSQALKDIVPY
ncbi:MAG: hypothetical protein NTZ85_01975 [Bacteroidia bacterium]|nr:hypothetical protein [Bacteroidia bacterium]